MSGPFAFVTLLSSDSYLPGALVLAASLHDLHPTPAVAPEVDFKTVCLVTPETVDVKSIKALRKAYDIVIGVEVLESETNSRGLQLLGECPKIVLSLMAVFHCANIALLRCNVPRGNAHRQLPFFSRSVPTSSLAEHVQTSLTDAYVVDRPTRP
jgi:hypothetical protein